MHDQFRIRLTLSDDAIIGLRRYIPAPQNPSQYTSYEWDGATSVYTPRPRTTNTRHYLLPPDYNYGAPHPLQGISACLALLSLTIASAQWIDNRPPHIIRQHQAQLTSPTMPVPFPLTSSIKDARAYLQLYSRPTYRAHWHDLFDTPRSRHELKLTPFSRSYFYDLAILHKMSPWARGGRNLQASYISAAVEAIGLSYLVTPQEQDDDTSDDDC